MRQIRQLAVVAVVVAAVLVGASTGVGAGARAPRGGGPAAPGAAAEVGYTPIGPVRVLDTRRPVGPANPASGTVGPGEVLVLEVAGVGGVPEDATAVVANVTATGGTAASNLRVWAAGDPVPATSNVNWSAGQTIPNLVVAEVGEGGAVAVRNQSGEVHVIVDVQGYWAPGGDGYTPVEGSRILDSRGMPAPLGAAETWSVGADQIVPAGTDASAVVVNVTVTGGSEASDLRMWSTGDLSLPVGQPTLGVPTVSNLNWLPGETRANLAVVPAGAGGGFHVRNAKGSVHVIVDAVGYLSPDGEHVFSSQGPRRLFDTRTPTGPLTGVLAAGQERSVVVVGDPVPDDATAVVLNLTVTGGTAPSHLTVWPTGAPRPGTSVLNWPTGDTRANLVVVPVGDGGSISLRNQAGTVHVIADVVGWFVDASAVPPGPGVWTDITDRLPDLEDVVLREVSCVSDTFCMAAGERVRSISKTDAIALVWDGVTWTEVASPSVSDAVVDGIDYDTVMSLSCATPTWCGIALVWDIDDDDPLYGGVWDGTTWDMQPADDNGSWDPGDEIVCSEAGACTLFAQGYAAEWDGAAWDRINGPFAPLACAAAESCVGTTDQVAGTALATWDGHDIAVPPAPPGLSPDLVGVAGACDSATDCVVLAQDGPGNPATFTWDGAGWLHGPAVPRWFDEWRSGSCAGPTECLAVVDVDGTDHTVRWADGTWTEVDAAPSPAYDCVAGMCMAVASEGSGTVHPRAWIFLASGAVFGDPGTWTDVSPPPDLFADAVLDDLSCTGPDHCVAELDPGYGIPFRDSVLAVWDGEIWATEPLPIESPPSDPEELYPERIEVRGVSCGTPTSCGVLMTREIDDQSIWVAAHWDTTEWDLFEIGSLMAEWRTVECAVDGTCRVRSDGLFVDDLLWDGDTWSEVAKEPGPHPPLPGTVHQGGEVSCAGPDDCTYVGVSDTGTGPARTRAAVHLRWDGATWSDTGALPAGIVTVGAGPYSISDILPAAGCAGPDECVALFRFTDGEQRALRWDGTSWSLAGDGPVFTSPTGITTGQADCRPGWCMVVGGEYDGTVHAPVAWTHTWPSLPG